MKLVELKIINKCPDGKICPAAFKNEQGDIIFIGKNPDSDLYDNLKHRVGDDESIVIIPKTLMEEIKGLI